MSAAAGGQEPITAGTSRQTILEILDDRRTLTEAVISSAVEVVGLLEFLLRAHAGLMRYAMHPILAMAVMHLTLGL